MTPDAFFAMGDNSLFSSLKFSSSDCGSRAVGFERTMRDARMADFWDVRNALNKWGRSNACTYDSCTSCTGVSKVSGSMGECAWLNGQCMTPDAFFAMDNAGSLFSSLKFNTNDCGSRGVGLGRTIRDARMADFWEVRNVLSKSGRSNSCDFDSCSVCTAQQTVARGMGECAWLNGQCMTPDAFFAMDNAGSLFSSLKFETSACGSRAVEFERMM